MGTPADPWKGVLPMWLGIAAAWGGLLVLGVLLAPDWLAAAIVVQTLTAIVAGIVTTRRLIVRNRQLLITPMDLRRR